MIFRFANGYGASVVRFKLSHPEGFPRLPNRVGYGSYTDNEDEWELAVIKFKNKKTDECKIVYDTGITEDVMGDLLDKDVEKVLAKIKKL